MSKSAHLTNTQKIAISIPIIVAIIGLIGTLISNYWSKEPTTLQEIEYVGRVIDSTTKEPIVDAEVSLALEGVPPVVYTDSQGVYVFKVSIKSEISGQVRVDAQGYQTYTQNISISPDIKTIDDIRLTPKASAVSAPSTALQLGKWGTDYFSNTQLNPPVTYHTDQPAEQNTEGGYTIQFNSVDLHSNPQIPQSNFSVRLSGLFYFAGGYYEFHCEHHDGCRVYVDGKNWIDAWWDGGGGHDMAKDIPAGNHIVSIEFYDKSGLGLLQVTWRIKPPEPIDTLVIPTSIHPTVTPIPPTLIPLPSPTPTPVIITDRESPMVFILAGYFQVYAKSGTAQTYVNGFYIDQHEVTNAEYQKCVITGGCSKPYSDAASQYANIVHFGDTAYDNYPVVLVSWHMAQNYCKWRGTGTRLPTDVEWEKAARGGLVNQPYPWGSTAPVCSLGSPNGSNFSDCGSKDVVPVETYLPNGYGIYDMAGNASEWVDKIISGDIRMIRGGSWFDSANQLTVFSNVQGSYLDGYINVGFRCAKFVP
jgi:hypothetical protein